MALAGGLAAPAVGVPGKAQGPTQRLQNLQVLSITDFHGNLKPTTIKNMPGSYGGVAYLATHLNQLREGQANTITLANGDNVGASPLISAAFHDEPTIEAFNKMGVDASTIGNHDFDEGYQEMLRLINGGCLPDGDGAANQNSCPDGTYAGADFPFVAANVFYAGTDKTVLPPYTVLTQHGIKIGVIGAVLKDTPAIVTAAGVAGLTFTDEVPAINKASAELTKQGINTQIVLVHQGGYAGAGSDAAYTANCADGSQVNGAVVPIAQQASPAVDYIVTGHAHQEWVCTMKDPAGMPRLVTEARSYGQVITEAVLPYDPKTKDIVRGLATAQNHYVTNDVAPDPTLQSLVDKYDKLVAPIAARVIGSLTAPVTRLGAQGYGDTSLGNLIADAQLADPSVVSGGTKPVIAFMNPGGIRADLDAGDVTFGEAFAVQPFNNYLVSMDLTGAQIYQLLAEQVSGKNSPSTGGYNKILQVSAGFTYTLGATGAVDGSVKLNGTPIDKTATYRIVTNNFLSDGGDNFPTFTSGTAKLIGGLDIDAFAAYLTDSSPVTPVAPSRIVKA